MENIIKVRAHIQLVSSSIGRKTPFLNGYRPLFDFKDASTKISGKIELINSQSFAPEAEGDVYISFIRGIIDDRHFKNNITFKFSEGLHPIGEGVILEVIM